MTDKPMTDAEAMKFLRWMADPDAGEPGDGVTLPRAIAHIATRLAQQPARGGEVVATTRHDAGFEPGPLFDPDAWERLRRLPKGTDLYASTDEACAYCGPGRYSGLPGGACENCMGTRLAQPRTEQPAGSCNCEVSAGLAAFHKDDCRSMQQPAAEGRGEVSLVDAVREYQREFENPAPDYVMRRMRRDEMFAALAAAINQGEKS